MELPHLKSRAGAVIVAFLAIPTSASAQIVQGIVRDTTTGSAVTGARVTVSDHEGRPVRTIMSGPNGSFTFVGPESGTYFFVVRRVGYRPLIAPPIVLNVLDTLQTQYFLQPIPVELDPVLVEAEAIDRFREVRFLSDQGFYERARRTAGRFLDPAAIDRRRDTTKRADYFLSGTAFVTPMAGSHRGFRLRCGRPHLFLDGRDFYGDDFDQAIGPDDVLAIEIYDTINNGGILDIFYGKCAVVLWTRTAAGG
jgi:hypothetical protein